MSDATHPSAEQLSTYFDKELTPQETGILEAHVNHCSDCRSVLESFSVISELGPRVEESLPGDGYWLDLPDRILARIASEDGNSRPVVSEAPPSFWERMWRPGRGWGLALGGLATGALAVLVWFGIPGGWNPGNPALEPIAENTPASAITDFDDPSTSLDSEAPENMSPEAFANRVIMTLGGAGNLGTSLDILPGQPVTESNTVSRVGSQVTQSLPPLGMQARAETEGVLSYGCGENPLERAFVAAVKAEEVGNYPLAMQGYHMVRSLAEPMQPLHCEADFRLTYLQWLGRVRQRDAGDRARALANLHAVANRSYQRWQQTQRVQDCQKAWCMNRALLKLSLEATAGEDVQTASNRVSELSNCGR